VVADDDGATELEVCVGWWGVESDDEVVQYGRGGGGSCLSHG
jgi:hypothetical protein